MLKVYFKNDLQFSIMGVSELDEFLSVTDCNIAIIDDMDQVMQPMLGDVTAVPYAFNVTDLSAMKKIATSTALYIWKLRRDAGFSYNNNNYASAETNRGYLNAAVTAAMVTDQTTTSATYTRDAKFFVYPDITGTIQLFSYNEMLALGMAGDAYIHANFFWQMQITTQITAAQDINALNTLMLPLFVELKTKDQQ